jgi:UDP-glucose 4-epimerase
MTWLVTGGAGYIGAHVVGAMQAAGEDVVVLDDLSTGFRHRLGDVPLVVGNVLDRSLVEDTMRSYGVHGIVHMAAKKAVEDSLRRPSYYYEQNVEGLRRLLAAAIDTDVNSFVFSSSAAVYGSTDVDRVGEDLVCQPINPYGRSKLIGEWMVEDCAVEGRLRFANLRYFNVAGSATPELADSGESNLVPMVFRRLSERRAPLIFGDGYATPDGTCIRDFVHVSDVASAHVAAARALADGTVSALTANIGTGRGVSVREMVQTIREVTHTAEEAWSEPNVVAARPGDPASVVASSARIEDVLGWRARFEVRDMVASAWAGWVADAGAPRTGQHQGK